MAPKQPCAILDILAIFIPSILAKEFVVGDDKGWTLNFNYQAWAQGKEFVVGDKLIFNINAAAHIVIRANQTDFQQCNAPIATEPLNSGNDVIISVSPVARNGTFVELASIAYSA